MKEILFVSALTLFVLSEARPGAVIQKPVELEKSVNAEENHVRVRRGYFDYGDFMSNFWENMNKCTNCNTLNVGNGYKNWNKVVMDKRQKSSNQNIGMLNIGNGYKNRNTVFLGTGSNSPNQDIVSVGNGSKNTNTVYFGVNPGSVKGDPFTGSFWED
ncbi:uncharacterized protein LOC123866151 isoform X1 [Maniola jurtina]|uniref:uncharacterized protein LOC123866151 isoform X1 n=1 Tax=Maniola jurtina TaxID=191418 RepID=UPI001E68BC6D|nr:uncharacterized protein LOC123866151 isoform X1 [Maniola jurtina]